MFRSASLFIGTSFTVAVFTIFATSNVDSIVGTPHKIYSMQRILIHIKSRSLVKCAHLHPGYAANLVARSWYYHCRWTLLTDFFRQPTSIYTIKTECILLTITCTVNFLDSWFPLMIPRRTWFDGHCLGGEATVNGWAVAGCPPWGAPSVGEPSSSIGL